MYIIRVNNTFDVENEMKYFTWTFSNT